MSIISSYRTIYSNGKKFECYGKSQLRETIISYIFTRYHMMLIESEHNSKQRNVIKTQQIEKCIYYIFGGISIL